MVEIGIPDELTIPDAAAALKPEGLRSGSDQLLQIDWFFVAGVFNFHALALLALFPWFFSWTGVILVPLGMYIFGTIGIDIGLHRLLTHRSFSSPRWLERAVVLLGTCCVMESPPYWVAVHRRHHQFADEQEDPHSPCESFLWAHLGWYLVSMDPIRRAELLERYAKDVMREPLYASLERDFNWVKLIVISWLVFFGAGLCRIGDGREYAGCIPIWRERTYLGRLREDCDRVPDNHVREFDRPSMGLPQLCDER